MPPASSNNYAVAIRGTDLTFNIDENDTLLGGLLRCGVGFPYECNAGGCGSCKYTLIDGDVEDDMDDSPGLKNSDRRKNKHLACISHIKSDCTIWVKLDDSYIPKHSPVVRKARLAVRKPVTHDLWEFEFQTDMPAIFLPGQYAKMRLPEINGPRSYSMSNVANANGRWQFLIKRTEGGEATELLFADSLDTITVSIDAPYSIACLNEEPNSQIVCIGGGSGVAPMISILRSIYRTERHNSRPILVYGGRTERDIVPPDYFSFAPDFDADIQYLPIVSEPDSNSGWTGATGFVHEHLDAVVGPENSNQEFFIAGPPPMVEAVRRYLVLDRGISMARLHYDRFF